MHVSQVHVRPGSSWYSVHMCLFSAYIALDVSSDGLESSEMLLLGKGEGYVTFSLLPTPFQFVFRITVCFLQFRKWWKVMEIRWSQLVRETFRFQAHASWGFLCWLSSCVTKNRAVCVVSSHSSPPTPPMRLPRAPSSGVSLLRQMFRDARGCVCFTFPSSSFVTHSGNVMQNSTVINATLGFHLFLLIFCQASVTWLPNSNSDELAPPPHPQREALGLLSVRAVKPGGSLLISPLFLNLSLGLCQFSSRCNYLKCVCFEPFEPKWYVENRTFNQGNEDICGNEHKVRDSVVRVGVREGYLLVFHSR